MKKEIILINDDFKLNKKELKEFIYLLKEENLLNEYLPLISKKINVEEFFCLVKDNNNFKKQNNEIIYHNDFSNEYTKIIINDKIIIESNVLNPYLEKYFYFLTDNYIYI